MQIFPKMSVNILQYVVDADTPPYTNVDESCGEYNGFLRRWQSSQITFQ